MSHEDESREALVREVAALREQVADLRAALAREERAGETWPEREDYYRALAEASPDCVFVLDRELRVRYANSASARALDCPPEDLIGKPLDALFPPQTVARQREHLGAVFESGKPQFFEAQVEFPGRTVWLETLLVPLGAEAGPAHAVLGISRDVTARVRAEMALAESERRYRAIVTDQTELICRFLPDGRITFVNEALSRVVGKRTDELIGQSFLPFIPQGDLERLFSLLATLSVEDPVGAIEHRVQAPTGEIRWQQWVNCAVFDEQGRFIEYQGVGRDITDRKRAEEALRRSEQEKQAILDSMSEVVEYLDRDLRVVWANRATARELGRPLGELVGRRCHENWHGRGEPCPNCPAVQALRTGEPCEAEIAAPDGRTWIVRDYPVRGADGEVVGVVDLSLDISERQRAERALRASEARYRTIVDTAQEGIWMVDAETRTTYVNQRMADLLGYTTEEITGRSFLEFMDDEARALAARNFERRKEGVPERYDFRFRRKDGSDLWSIVSVNPLFSEAGQFVGALAMVTDITERKRAEDALRESEEKFRNLSEEITDGVAVTVNDRNLWVNRAFCELFGYTRDELIGQGLEFLIVPEEVPRLKQYSRDRHAGRETPAHYETLARRKDGTQIRIDVIAEVVTFENQRAIQVVVRDVTEQRKLEEELLRAQKLESIGLLAGGIAHDFGNLLTGIAAHIAVARQSLEGGSEALEPLTQAEKAALRAKGLTQQLLTFSRGGMPSRTPTPLSDLLPETAALALSGSNVRAQFSVPDDLWPADADSAQIGQVIQNLALNAAQAMPDGGTVELRARNLTLTGQDPLPLPPGRYVQVSVTDHGVGIPEENLPRIFLPYFTTKESGSGLGLAISYSIVKKHDGHITVESAPGVGTTVHVYLPASERGPASAPEPPPRKVRACKKVLLMDDEELVRKGAAWLLRDAGYEVECAREGAEAVELYREALEANRPFDAVVLDLTVPGGVGGQECIRQLRALDPRVRAIVCSGYSDEPVVADFRQYGFRGVVTKPFTLDDLLAALEGAVAGGEEEGP